MDRCFQGVRQIVLRAFLFRSSYAGVFAAAQCFGSDHGGRNGWLLHEEGNHQETLRFFLRAQHTFCLWPCSILCCANYESYGRGKFGF
jgi:hypothetical protein